MMIERVRVRFWIETVSACLGTLLALATLVHRTWIETALGIDPDQGSGAMEWLIVGVALAVAVTSLTLARQEWRRRAVTA